MKISHKDGVKEATKDVDVKTTCESVRLISQLWSRFLQVDE